MVTYAQRHNSGIVNAMANRINRLPMMTAARIKATRKRFGESQKAFARRLGVTQATLSRWEARGFSPAMRAAIVANGKIAMLAAKKGSERDG